MISESSERHRFFSLILEKTSSNLKKHGFESVVLETPEAARSFFFSRVQPGMTIGFGGSRTVVELSLIDSLRSMGSVTLLDRMRDGITKEEKARIERSCFSADVFLASANAVSETGLVVNIDKWGNRTAAIEFGPEKVFLFVGRNKIVPTLEDAIARSQSHAAVMNNIRFENKTPCVHDGQCHDCLSADRICGILSVIMRSSVSQRICVVLINADLGF
jgi:hypothetical protein